MRTRLVEELVKLQGESSGQEFAADIGLDRSAWSRIARGKRSLSQRTARLVIAKWPHLAWVYLADISGPTNGKADQVARQLDD